MNYFAGKRIVAAAAGREHSLLLTDAGEVYACGTEFFGQCGQSMAVPYVKTPVRVTGELADKKVVKIFAGEYHSIAICDDHSTYLWGGNKEGTLGQGDRSDIGSPRLLEAKLEGRIVQAAGGGGHTLFLTDANKLYATGRGRSGQLGRGDKLESMAAYRTEPVLVQSLQHLVEPGSRIISIAAGRDHSMAVVERGVPSSTLR
jgi:regulator of chromosome condensation